MKTKKLFLLLIGVLCIFRIAIIPFLGNPLLKIKYYYGVDKYLENKYASDDFDVKKVTYDWKRSMYYAEAESKAYPHISSFQINITSGSIVEYWDDLPQRIRQKEISEHFRQIGSQMSYYDMNIDCFIRTQAEYRTTETFKNVENDHITINLTIYKSYKKEDLELLYQLIVQAKKELTSQFIVKYEAENEVTTFWFGDKIYDIYSRKDILEVCTPSVRKK